MTAHRRLTLLRVFGFGVGALLLAGALLQLMTQSMRPDFRSENLFTAAAQGHADATNPAAPMFLDGKVRADVAALLAQKALGASPSGAERTSRNKLAQDATISTLKMSPVNSLMWLTLGLLKAQAGEPSGLALKTSYLTGPLSRDATVARVQAVSAGDAVDDEDARMLAQSDVRSILTKYSLLEPALAAAYRQAPPKGKTFLLDAIQVIDPRFSRLLQQYP